MSDVIDLGNSAKLSFDTETETGMYKKAGKYCYSFKGERVARDVFLDKCAESGLLDPMSALLFKVVLPID